MQVNVQPLENDWMHQIYRKVIADPQLLECLNHL